MQTETTVLHSWQFIVIYSPPVNTTAPPVHGHCIKYLKLSFGALGTFLLENTTLLVVVLSSFLRILQYTTLYYRIKHVASNGEHQSIVSSLQLKGCKYWLNITFDLSYIFHEYLIIHSLRFCHIHIHLLSTCAKINIITLHAVRNRGLKDTN